LEASKLLIEEKKIPVYKSDGITIIGEFVINKDVSIETSVEPELFHYGLNPVIKILQ